MRIQMLERVRVVRMRTGTEKADRVRVAHMRIVVQAIIIIRDMRIRFRRVHKGMELDRDFRI